MPGAAHVDGGKRWAAGSAARQHHRRLVRLQRRRHGDGCARGRASREPRAEGPGPTAPGRVHRGDGATSRRPSARNYYDPESARYLSPDPLGLLPAPNPNTYVHNPHTWTDPLGLAPTCREPGLREDAQLALTKLENIKKDPVGAINSQPNHNHYSAARREANGEVVARKPDGTPYDHRAGARDPELARGAHRHTTKGLRRCPSPSTPPSPWNS
ncbi:hypothetical protein GCM10010244_11060 [Streptomyces coeruleorubidus]|nr:hypothetical protein GCM10010244_11060 [Streptomyces bellus]